VLTPHSDVFLSSSYWRFGSTRSLARFSSPSPSALARSGIGANGLIGLPSQPRAISQQAQPIFSSPLSAKETGPKEAPSSSSSSSSWGSYRLFTRRCSRLVLAELLCLRGRTQPPVNCRPLLALAPTGWLARPPPCPCWLAGWRASKGGKVKEKG